MRSGMKNILTVILCITFLCNIVGCQHVEKEPRPAPKSTIQVDDGNANAAKGGNGQADVPLVIGCQSFSGQFNPFAAETSADRQAVSLTQVSLLIHDRAGKTVYHGIDGELRGYNGNNYTYYGIADITVAYYKKKDKTEYHITLRDDLVFSDGEKLTIDDVIFSMYVFCDNDYKGDVQLKNMPVKGLEDYQEGSAGSISGIQRVNDYELKLVTTGYNRRLTTALEIPVCALHYYGDVSEYNVDKGKFGFTKGDISQVLAKKTAPVGAGPYCFVKYESNIVYYTSNELYYLGCPETAYLQLKDMTDILEETKEQIQIRQKEYEEWEKSQADTDSGEQDEAPSADTSEAQETAEPEATPMSSVNPLAEVTEISGGGVDVMQAVYSKADLYWIYNADSNEKISAQLLSDGKYHYIGVNAEKVAVKGKAGSKKSKYLRRALAAILSDSRKALTESEDILAELVNYPVVKESWVSLQESEDDYETAYSKDIHGETGQAASMALEYLEAAGYTVDGGKVKKAPEGGAVKYKALLAGGENNPLYLVLKRAKETFENIGITLEIVSVNTEEKLYRELRKGKYQLWVGSRDKEDLELQLRYSKNAAENFFGIQDKKLNQRIEKLQTMLSSAERKKLYRKCFDTVLDWAVEIPVCEFQKVELFSTQRINASTIPDDTTTYYSWMNELQKVRMK